jgi:predicted DNA-binding transcriptional regulator AlpA
MTLAEIALIIVSTYPDGRMDTNNASKYTGLSEKTLAMFRCNGKGPKFIKRGRIFYYQSDIDEWMNANGRITSTAQAKKQPPNQTNVA